MKKNDVILIGSIAIVLLLVIGAMFLFKREGAEVVIWVDGTEYAVYELEKDREVEIPGALGTSRLIIRDGYAWMEEAACPDQICVHTGKIRYNTDMPIVCLPGKIVVSIRGGEEASELDATGR
ncbi:MAG: NusG domain II-containing protein [Lachnospiraceae bacterium]